MQTSKQASLQPERHGRPVAEAVADDDPKAKTRRPPTGATYQLVGRWSQAVTCVACATSKCKKGLGTNQRLQSRSGRILPYQKKKLTLSGVEILLPLR